MERRPTDDSDISVVTTMTETISLLLDWHRGGHDDPKAFDRVIGMAERSAERWRALYAKDTEEV